MCSGKDVVHFENSLKVTPCVRETPLAAKQHATIELRFGLLLRRDVASYLDLIEVTEGFVGTAKREKGLAAARECDVSTIMARLGERKHSRSVPDRLLMFASFGKHVGAG